jgi:hypothetical protein
VTRFHAAGVAQRLQGCDDPGRGGGFLEGLVAGLWREPVRANDDVFRERAGGGLAEHLVAGPKPGDLGAGRFDPGPEGPGSRQRAGIL